MKNLKKKHHFLFEYTRADRKSNDKLSPFQSIISLNKMPNTKSLSSNHSFSIPQSNRVVNFSMFPQTALSLASDHANSAFSGTKLHDPLLSDYFDSFPLLFLSHSGEVQLKSLIFRFSYHYPNFSQVPLLYTAP